MGARIRAWDEAIGAVLDRCFPAALNPWRHLGPLAFLFFVVCTATGAYAYAVFDTSLAGAYDSGRALDASVVGRLVRGVHRYSADAFALATAAHLLREAARGHFRAWRAWSWLSGVVLLPLAWIAGITGFWLAWDERALFSVVATAEWFAAWPFESTLFVRNFVTGEAINDRFFSLAVFVHIGVPLFALAGTWAHVQRLAHVRAWPPRAVTVAAIATLCVLALVHPATSLGRADALAEPAALAMDWFFFFPHALAAAMTPQGLWIATAAAAVVLLGLPWAGKRSVAPAARVDLGNCNGCARCAADCPFAAVVMVPRSDGRAHAREARVVPDLCAACGICAGACPSSTPFRHAMPFVSGIDLPQRPVATLRTELDALLRGRPAEVVFACRAAAVDTRGFASVEVECAAMVPPAFVQYALRQGTRAVVMAGCREGDCEFRVGDRWTRERFAGVRAPALRASVPRERVHVVFCGSDRTALERAIATSRTSEEPSHA